LKTSKYLLLAQWSKVEEIIGIEKVKKSVEDLDNKEFDLYNIN
jgi:hypothetical protein